MIKETLNLQEKYSIYQNENFNIQQTCAEATKVMR